MEDPNQTASCKRLLSAVVTLSIIDACLPPHRSKGKAGMKYTSSRTALDAMRFLMGDGAKGYIEHLGMDSGRFKDQLIKQMWDDSERGYLTEKISGQQRRNFRFNLHSFQNIPKAGQPMSDEEIDKISHRNAMRLFNYDPFSILGRENCTVGALRAQAEGWDVSIVARGIKASGTGAADLKKFAKAD